MFCQASGERNLLSADLGDRSAAVSIPRSLATVSLHLSRMFCQASGERNTSQPTDVNPANRA
ncbi:hypothetical protein BZP36_22730 [Raoultella terrigena]|nr:hypothetical protein [Raoultella sp. BIGb0132]MCS4288688.1 hypothetical protein [Raoultella terrigena]OMP90726.1 hypothetical protein BZP36_22730 [Raoultella terrigena]